MTNKDILDLTVAKSAIGQSSISRMVYDKIIGKLIQEVEKLRDFAEQVDDGLLERDDKIESITKELEEAKKENERIQSAHNNNLRLRYSSENHLKEQLKAVKKENAELKAKVNSTISKLAKDGSGWDEGMTILFNIVGREYLK